MNRFDVLTELIEFSKPLGVISNNLSRLGWDDVDCPLSINALQVQNVLHRFIAGQLTSKDIENWANLVECREDLEFEIEKNEVIENAIYCLANPFLEGEITIALCDTLIISLS